MASNPDWRSEREAKLERLHEKLTTAVESLVTSEDWTRAMVFAAQFRSRSFANTLLIYAQHAERFAAGSVPEPWPSYVAGFRQWESLGRAVNKGQRGYMIQAPVTSRFASANPSDANSWRKLGFREAPKAGEVARTKIVNVKPAYVWDVCQTSGEPVPERPGPKLLEGRAPEGLWDGLAKLVEAEGFELSRVAGAREISGANGVTDYLDRTVKVRADMEEAAQVKTLAHELAHVRMHEPSDEDASHHRGIGEVEAESVAMMIGAAHGMPTNGYTIPYVSGWATTVKGKAPAEVVQATGERVRATALAILNALDTEQIGGGDPPGLDRAALANKPKVSRAQALAGVEAPPLAGQVMSAVA
ncbi:MAG: ImmA/IrrE family metallo-endopeptidase [Bifidobacteriaceae bacterium]|jgi:antirestriction protein ArdC|nr:ImmA/IrrE family metallo-endopeptidase [Bifidobacteriaceae bacterium]